MGDVCPPMPRLFKKPETTVYELWFYYSLLLSEQIPVSTGFLSIKPVFEVLEH